MPLLLLKESRMLETAAMVLFILWVLGLTTGYSLGGAIHVLLLGGIASLYFDRRAVSRVKSSAKLSPSHMLAHLVGKPSVPRKPAPAKPPQAAKPAQAAKTLPGKASRPSAAA